MHDDAIKLQQLATMTDRLLLRAGRTHAPVVIAPELTGDRFSVPSLAKPGRHARVSPRLARAKDRAPAPSPVRSPAPSPARSPARSVEGSTVHGYAPAPRGPEPVAPVAFAKGSISPELSAHEAFPPEPVAQSLSYERAPRAAVARGSAPQLAPSPAPPALVAPGAAAPGSTAHAASPRLAQVWRVPVHESEPEPERTVFVRPLPSPVPISLATRAVRALRSPSFAAKIIIPALVGAILGLVAML